MVTIFKHNPQSDDPWNAYNAAAAWCRTNGYSVGTMERGSPTGVLKGDYDINKWRNMSTKDRAGLSGTIEGVPNDSFRDRNVKLVLK